MRPPKVVFDTNIIISAVIFGGNPKQCLELARKGGVSLVISRPILFEMAKKLQEKFDWETLDVKELIEGFAKFAQVVEPKESLNAIKADPDDNKILECALEGNVDYIVSGDKKHLLSLKKFKKIPVVSAIKFLEIFYTKN